MEEQFRIASPEECPPHSADEATINTDPAPADSNGAAALESGDSVEEIVTSIKRDETTLYSPEITDRLVRLRRHDPQGFARLKKRLKEDRIPTDGHLLRMVIGEAEKRLKQAEQEAAAEKANRRSHNSRASAPGSADDESGVIRQRRVRDILPTAPASDAIVPAGFDLSPDGTWRLQYDERTGDTSRVPLAPVPILITGKLSDRTTRRERLRLSWRDQRGWRHRIVDRADMVNDRRILDFAAFGFPVYCKNAKGLAEYLFSFDAANNHTPEVALTGRCGWQGAQVGPFVLGNACILPDGALIDCDDLDELDPQAWADGLALFREDEAGDREIVQRLVPAGSLEGHVAALNRIEPYPCVRFAALAALSAPLLVVVGCKSYGIDLSSRTSTGKSVTLQVASSLFGNGELWDWHCTLNWIDRTCGILNGLPFILDDTKKAKDSQFIEQATYDIISGRGKGRANKTGRDAAPEWLNVFLTCGEQSLVSYTTAGGTRARIITNQRPPFGDASEEAQDAIQAILDGIEENHGHVGRVWLQFIQRHRNEWPEWKRAFREGLAELRTGAANTVIRRLACAGALIRLTDCLVRRALAEADCPLLWPEADPLEEVWDAAGAEAADPTGALRALDEVYAWASSNPDAFFGRSKRTDQDGNPILPPGGWYGRWEDGEQWDDIAFVPTRLCEFLDRASYSHEAILVEWKQRGFLDIGANRKYDKTVRLGEATPRLIVIRRDALLRNDEEDPTCHVAPADAESTGDALADEHGPVDIDAGEVIGQPTLSQPAAPQGLAASRDDGSLRGCGQCGKRRPEQQMTYGRTDKGKWVWLCSDTCLDSRYSDQGAR